MTNQSCEEAILRLARARAHALVTKDSPAMRRLLADNFRYINASGMVLSRDEYLAAYVAAAEVRWTSQDLDDCAVTCYGDTAVLTCRVHDRGQMEGEPFDAIYRSLFVWVLAAGAWRCVAGQTTAVAAPE
jgi:hypothetical protein